MDNILHSIEIDVRWGLFPTPPNTYIASKLEIYNFTTGNWKLLDQIVKRYGGFDGKNTVKYGNPYIIKHSDDFDASQYLNDSNDDGYWDEIKIRFRYTTNDGLCDVKTTIYYISAKIRFYGAQNRNATLMFPIVENAASTLTCPDIDYDDIGIAVDDKFKIGEWTQQIIYDVCGRAGLDYYIFGMVENDTITLTPNTDITTDWSLLGAGADYYAAIDEGIAGGDGNYVGASAAAGDHLDTCVFGFYWDDYGIIPQTIDNVNVAVRAWDVNTAGDMWIDLSLDGGSNWEGQQAFAIDGGYATYDHDYTVSDGSLDDCWDIEVKIIADVAIPKPNELIYVDAIECTVTADTTPFKKFLATDFTGSYCIDALNAVCRIENAYWCEDHANEQILISKLDDFIDSGVDLDSSDYDYDWKFDDICNAINNIEVHARAGGIKIKGSCVGDETSMIDKAIIDETLGSYDAANAVADGEIAKYGSKNPNIVLTLNGTNTSLLPMYKVHITFARPTIAQAFYPIRKIQRKRRGQTGIETKIWCGLGKASEPEDIISDLLLRLDLEGSKANRASLTREEGVIRYK